MTPETSRALLFGGRDGKMSQRGGRHGRGNGQKTCGFAHGSEHRSPTGQSQPLSSHLRALSRSLSSRRSVQPHSRVPLFDICAPAAHLPSRALPFPHWRISPSKTAQEEMMRSGTGKASEEGGINRPRRLRMKDGDMDESDASRATQLTIARAGPQLQVNWEPSAGFPQGYAPPPAPTTLSSTRSCTAAAAE